MINMVTITLIFTSRSDLATFEIPASTLFGSKANRFHIVNSYCIWGSPAKERTHSPTLALPGTHFPTWVVGDFNIHHPLADPIRRHNSSQIKASFLYFSRAAELGYTLLNSAGHTCFPLQGLSRYRVLDRAFVSSSQMPFCKEWTTDLPSTSPDHVPITITMAHQITAPPPPAPKWVRTDSPTLEPLLKDAKVVPPPDLPTRHLMENWFDSHLKTLVTLLKPHTPRLCPSVRANPSWSL